MELQTIQTQTTWNDAAERINRNNLKIATELAKLGASTYKNKGYFATAESLVNAYPTASAGSIAYVGSSYPYVNFYCSFVLLSCTSLRISILHLQIPAFFDKITFVLT